MEREIFCPRCGRFQGRVEKPEELYRMYGKVRPPTRPGISSRCRNCKRFVFYDLELDTVRLVTYEENNLLLDGDPRPPHLRPQAGGGTEK